MTDEHHRFWEILDEMSVGMVTTADGGVMRARPMAPFVDAEARTLYFVTDSDSAKVLEISTNRDVAVSFANTSKMLFASVSGKGIISRNRDVIKRLWGPYCDVFFDGGPETADVVAIKIVPEQAEYWDNDMNKVAMAVEMTRAYFSDGGPDLGSNEKLSF